MRNLFLFRKESKTCTKSENFLGSSRKGPNIWKKKSENAEKVQSVCQFLGFILTIREKKIRKKLFRGRKHT